MEIAKCSCRNVKIANNVLQAISVYVNTWPLVLLCLHKLHILVTINYSTQYREVEVVWKRSTIFTYVLARDIVLQGNDRSCRTHGEAYNGIEIVLWDMYTLKLPTLMHCSCRIIRLRVLSELP